MAKQILCDLCGVLLKGAGYMTNGMAVFAVDSFLPGVTRGRSYNFTVSTSGPHEPRMTDDLCRECLINALRSGKMEPVPGIAKENQP